MDRGRAFRQRAAHLIEAVVGGASLDESVLAISMALRPGVDQIGVLADLDQLAADCPTPTRDGVMQYLFGPSHHGRPVFVGDQTTYYAWQNSCLDLVLERRTGMPITLSVVAIEVARRIGVRLAGIGAPGHFLVGDPDDPNWYADPFRGVTGLTRADCRERFSGSIRGPWADQYLAPVPDRLIVLRILNNLSGPAQPHAVISAIAMLLVSEFPELAGQRDRLWAAVATLN